MLCNVEERFARQAQTGVRAGVQVAATSQLENVDWEFKDVRATNHRMLIIGDKLHHGHGQIAIEGGCHEASWKIFRRIGCRTVCELDIIGKANVVKDPFHSFQPVHIAFSDADLEFGLHIAKVVVSCCLGLITEAFGVLSDLPDRGG